MTRSPLISVERVTKRFPGVVALDGVSLQIARGECHAIVGENGAGKSTLMKILSGVIAQYEGEFRLRGQFVRFSSPRDAEAAGIVMIHQELNLVEQLTAAANVFLGREKVRPLGLLDDRSMQRVLKEVDTKELSMALKGASEELQEKFFRNMSSRAAEMIKEEMEYMGPIRLKDVEEVQQRIVDVIRRLEEDGEIIISGRSGEEEIVV